MAFTLPTDLSTSWVDDSSTITAADWNNTSAMTNAIKAAIATWGYNAKTILVATSESTTSASYADLTTTTDQVTAPIGSSGMALVMIKADVVGNNAGNAAFMGYALSGADTAVATDSKCVQFARTGTVSAIFVETGLTPGFTTFKLKYKSGNGGTQTFANRRIMVIPMPSLDGTHESGAFSVDATLAVGMAGSALYRPAYDSIGAGVTSTTTPFSWTHNIGADTKLLMVDVVLTYAASPSATVGGVSMGLVSKVSAYADCYLATFALYNPPTGTQTVEVTSAGNGRASANSTAYVNAASIRTVTTKTGSWDSASTMTFATTGNAGELIHQVYGGMYNLNATVFTNYNGTQRWIKQGPGSGGSNGSPILIGEANSALSKTDTVNFTVTYNDTTYGVAAIGASLSALPYQASFNLGLTPALSFTGRTNSAVTFDSVGAGFATAGATAPSWSHTIGASAKALVVIATFWNNGLGTPTFTNAKVGTKDLDVMGVFRNFTSAGWNTYTAYLGCVNPPTGTQTVTFTTGSAYIGAQSFAYNNVKTIGPLVQTSTPDVSSSDSTTIAATSTSSDEMVLASVSAYTTPFTGFTPNLRHNNAASLYWIAGDSDGVNGTVSLTAIKSVANLYGSGYVVMRPTQTTTAASFSLSLTPTIAMTGVGVPPAIQGSPNVAHASSVTIPTHAVGDLIVLFAHRGTTGSPSKPSAAGTVPAWVDIDTQSGSYSNCRTAYFVATATDHTSGTWTNADSMIAVVLRGQHTSTPIGGHAVSGESATGNTCPGAAVTMSKTDGSSALLAFYGFGDGANTVTSIASAPSGWTRQVTGTYAGTPGTALCLNTKNSTTSGGAQAQTSTTSCWTRSATVEVLS